MNQEAAMIYKKEVCKSYISSFGWADKLKKFIFHIGAAFNTIIVDIFCKSQIPSDSYWNHQQENMVQGLTF